MVIKAKITVATVLQWSVYHQYSALTSKRSVTKESYAHKRDEKSNPYWRSGNATVRAILVLHPGATFQWALSVRTRCTVARKCGCIRPWAGHASHLASYSTDVEGAEMASSGGTAKKSLGVNIRQYPKKSREPLRRSAAQGARAPLAQGGGMEETSCRSYGPGVPLSLPALARKAPMRGCAYVRS